MLATGEKKVEVHVLRLPTSIFFEESDGLDGDMNEARPRAGSLRSNSEREYYSSNPASLLSPSIPIASIAEGTATARTAPGAEVLSRSEHSLKTLRRNGSSSSLASASDDGAADSNRRTAGGDFVIEIPQAKVGKDERGEFGETRRIEEGGMSGGAVEDHSHRHRSNSGAASFGGVPLPPSQPQPRKPTLLTRLTSTTSIASSLNSPEATRQSVLPLSPASELHLGGSFAERRPVVAASLKAFALFLLSLAVLSALLHTMLPPIHRDDWQKLKLPKNIDDLKTLNSVLQIYKDRHYWRVMGSFTTIYLFLQAFSIPGSMYLSILAGAMYGVLIALPLVCFCVATGAVLCYLISMALGPALLSNSVKWSNRLETWKKRINDQGDNLMSYLIILRISPLPPHWTLNLLAPHLGISLWKFWVSTFFGIAGVTYIHTSIGTALDQMTSSDDFHLISWTNFLGLAGIVFAVMIPVALRYAWKKEITQAADSPQVYAESYASSSASLLVLDENEMVASSRRQKADTKSKKNPFHYHDETPDENAPFRIDDEDDDAMEGGGGAVNGRSRGNGREARTLDKASKILGVQLSQEEYSRR